MITLLCPFLSIPRSLHHMKISPRTPAHWPAMLNFSALNQWASQDVLNQTRSQSFLLRVYKRCTHRAYLKMSACKKAHLSRSKAMITRWRENHGRRFSVELQLSLPSFSTSYRCVNFSTSFANTELRVLTADKHLFWSKGYPTSSSSSPALPRPASCPSRSRPLAHRPNGARPH